MPQHVDTHVGVDPYHRFTEDPCESRHKGNVDSRTAWEKVSPRRQETYRKILAFYYDSPNPISPKEICQMMGVNPNDISGRFTELKEMGILHPIDDTFKGSRRLELVTRIQPGPLAQIVKAAVVSDHDLTPEQVLSKYRPIHGGTCCGLCCTTGVLLKDTYGLPR